MKQEPQGKDNCPSCEYHKQSERVWRDFANQQHTEIEALKAEPQYRNLSDEEMFEIWKQAIQDGYTEMIVRGSQTLDTKKVMFDFGRLILKKARGEE